MRVDEIRQFPIAILEAMKAGKAKDSELNIGLQGGILVMLAEIAAQIAEFNEMARRDR